MLSVGSLCTGYGGLEMGLQTVYSDIDLRFVSDIDKDVNTLLAHHHPNVPNLGDLTVVDWSDIEPVDVLCAGYPCQPFSHAGYRKGNNDERAIFEYIGDAISVLRPRNVLLENVSGHLTLGGTTVITILTRLGYDAKWGIVRASDASAPHQRKRLFIWCQSTYTDSTRRKRQSQKRSVGFNKNVPERTQTRYRHFTESDGTCIERFNFRQYEQAIRRWRMSQGTLLSEEQPSLQYLPDWGMTQNGALFELRTPQHLINARDSLYGVNLPTPIARDGNDRAKKGPLDLTRMYPKGHKHATDTLPRAMAHVLKDSISDSTNKQSDAGKQLWDE